MLKLLLLWILCYLSSIVWSPMGVEGRTFVSTYSPLNATVWATQVGTLKFTYPSVTDVETSFDWTGLYVADVTYYQRVNFFGSEVPSYIPNNGTVAILNITDPSGNVVSVTDSPSYAYAGTSNETVAISYDLTSTYNATAPAMVPAKNFLETVERSKFVLTMKRAADNTSVASVWVTVALWRWKKEKYYVRKAISSTYDTCAKITCPYPSGARLATIRTKDDYDEAVNAMKATSTSDVWVGMKNWGVANGSTQSLVCQDQSPDFTLAGCRAYDRNAVYDDTGCVASYCAKIVIDSSLSTRSDGKNAFRLKFGGTGYQFADQPPSTKKQGCICERRRRNNSTTDFFAKNGVIYWLQNFVGNKHTIDSGVLTITAVPPPTASPSVSPSKTSTFSLPERKRTSTRSATPTPTWSETSSMPLTETVEPPLTVSDSRSLQTVTSSLTVTSTRSVPSSKSRSLETSDSAALSVTTTVSLEKPIISITLPTSGAALSEKSIYFGRAEDRTIQFKVSGPGAEWDCRAMKARRFQLFQSTNSTPPSQGFFGRMNELLTVPSLTCGRTVATFNLPRDRLFSIESDEVMDVSLNASVLLLDSPRIDRTGVVFQTRVAVRNDRVPPVSSVPTAVTASAEATAATSTAVAAVAGNPAVAVSASRTALILSLVNCEDTTEDGMDWMSHPLGIEVGLGITGVWAGAALWNPVFVFGVCFLHFIAAWTVAAYRGNRIKYGMGKLYFPCIEAMLILPLLQPTAAATTTIFRQSSQFTQLMSALVGAISCVGFLVFIGRITLFKGFKADFHPYPKEGDNKRNCLRVFMTGPGDYIDTDGGDTFVRMHFLYFDIYRRDRVWFTLIEMTFTILFGVLEGWRPTSDSGCDALVVIMSAMFVIFFITVIVLRPYVSWFETILGILIVFIQMVGAVSTAVYSLGKMQPAINVGAWSATGGLYILSGKAAVDLGITIIDFVLDCCKKKEPSADDGSGKEFEEGLLAGDTFLTSPTGGDVEMFPRGPLGPTAGKAPPPIPAKILNPVAWPPPPPPSSPRAGFIPPPPPGPPPPHVLQRKAPPPLPKLGSRSPGIPPPPPR